MGRSPCCSKEGLNRGAWTALEDKILTDYIAAHGEGKWRNIPRFTGLKRCGKSCRLRWLNYLRPDIKRGNITPEEEDLIIRLHKLLGNRWSLIAGRLPGRTDNEIKNYWNTTLGKKVKGELPKQPKDSTVKRSKAKQPNVDIVPTIVIGTKLTKSDDIFIAQRKATAAVETNFSVDGNLVTSKNVVPELKFDEGSPSVASREDNFNNLVMDFDLSDLLLSDVHESEFWKLCQFDGGTGDSLDHPLHFSSEEIKGWVTDDGVRFNA